MGRQHLFSRARDYTGEMLADLKYSRNPLTSVLGQKNFHTKLKSL